MFARATTAKVVACDEHRGLAELALVEDEVGALRTIGVEAQLVKGGDTEARAL